MKHSRFLLNLFFGGILFGGTVLSGNPALARETVHPGSSGQFLARNYSWDNPSPDSDGREGIFGGHDPAGGAAALSRPKPPKPQSNGWGGIFGDEDPAGRAAALSRPKPPANWVNGNGWGGTFAGDDFSVFAPPVYRMLKVY